MENMYANFHSLSEKHKNKNKKHVNNPIQWFYRKRKCKCIVAHAYPPTLEHHMHKPTTFETQEHNRTSY